MKYFKLDKPRRAALMRSLASMQDFLAEQLGSLTPEEACKPGPHGSFSPVEQVWHLADLEREGFGLRIRRLRSEQGPHLPDFDGDRIAAERNYRSLSLADGLCAFADARQANLSVLGSLSADDWAKAGTQEGVGQVSLCDMPVFIAQHDQAHIAEILAWKRALVR